MKESSGFLNSHGRIVGKDPDLAKALMEWCTEQAKGAKHPGAWALMGYWGVSSIL